MTNPEVAILMLSLFIVLVLLGFPIAFTLLAMGVAFGYYAYYTEGYIEVFSDIFDSQIFYLLTKTPSRLWRTTHSLPYRCFCLWVMS